MAESRGSKVNPNDQGGGEPSPDIETKVNYMQSQICDISSVLQKLTWTLDRLVDKDHDMTDCRSEYSDYRTIDGVSEPGENRHTLRSSDANQSQFCSFDSRTPVHPHIVLDRTPDFNPYRPNYENQNQTRQTVRAKPDTYDGRSSWTDFITQFEIVCRLNNWSSEIKALQLAACLRGSARSVLTDLRPHQLDDYYELKFVLQTRFEPKNQTEMYRAELNSRYRKRDESLPELAQDIKRLARLAYPTAPCEVRDTLAYKCFRDALHDQDMEWAICQSASENIDEALNLALKFEAFKMSRNRKYTNTPHLRHQQEICDQSYQDLYVIGENSRTNVSRSEKETKKCFYCGKPGHFKNKCKKRLYDIQSGKLNTSSQRMYDRSNFAERSETSEIIRVRDCANGPLNDQRLSL